MVEFIVAIDETRVRFPADAFLRSLSLRGGTAPWPPPYLCGGCYLSPRMLFQIWCAASSFVWRGVASAFLGLLRICGLVVEFIVAIDETRVRFPADAFMHTR